MAKKALITGITGQDGSYLAELLLSKGYEVHGIRRRSSAFNTQRIDHIYVDPHTPNAKLFLHYGDLSDSSQISTCIHEVRPDEIYHLGAQSHVGVSFQTPEYTGDVVGLGTTRILEAIRRSGLKTRFYQASSSEMFGAAPPPQNEKTSFYPRSPYGVAKVYAYWATVNYRESYGMFAVNGILFNHESPRRGETFVTRKITRGLAKILAGKQPALFLGNLDARRDWGFAPDYVEAMWKMLQQSKPNDYVIGTGVTHSVREFVSVALEYAGIDVKWKGRGRSERAYFMGYTRDIGAGKKAVKKGQPIVCVDPRYFRPAEVDDLRADTSFSRKELRWEPRIDFKNLVRVMMDYDLTTEGLSAPGKGVAAVSQASFHWIGSGLQSSFAR